MREISLHILDILQNSVAAGADVIRTDIYFDSGSGLLKIDIADNGCGMDEETLARVTDPFMTSRTTRKVGLGIPLYKFYATLTGGGFDIRSKPGEGTKVSAVFNTKSIDCMPVGNLTDAILTTISSNHDIRFIFTFAVDGKSFEFDTDDVKDVLHDQNGYCDLTVYFHIREFIAGKIKEVNGGKLQL